MKNFKPELLSPVGDIERLQSALDYGADAVYLAGKIFGMRAAPGNFSNEELEKAVNLCHDKNVKVYVTCNTIPHNDEIIHLPEFLQFLNKIKVDGVIIADIGVLMLVKEHAPDVEIHISTQAGIANYQTAMAFYALGAKRVVLARELSLAEIIEIKSKIPEDLEIEVFVHGAMCVSFSGRCLLSSYMTGRDANRGDCAQPCRWEYELVETLKRPDEKFTIEEQKDESGRSKTFIMNSKDMCMIEDVPKLIQAGVHSLKVEGRAKSAYYVASTTSAYRNAIDFTLQNPDKKIPNWIIDETEKTSHRQYSKGFFTGEEPGQNTENGGYIRTWDVVAISQGRNGDYIELSQRNKFLKGDIADVLVANQKPFTVKLDEIFDKYEKEIATAPHATMTVLLKTDIDIPKGAYLRVKR
ncbi:MAG: U32 family peptidase [Clostridia bacterium]